MDNLLPLKDGSGLIDAEFHKSVGPEHAVSVAEQVVSPEEFFAEDTTPLAETKPEWIKHWKETDEVFASPTIKVDGDRTQLTEAQMSGVVGEVLAQTIYSINGVEVPKYLADIDFERVNQIIWLAKKVKDLEETQTKLIAALKHLGLDTNKHFR